MLLLLGAGSSMLLIESVGEGSSRTASSARRTLIGETCDRASEAGAPVALFRRERRMSTVDELRVCRRDGGRRCASGGGEGARISMSESEDSSGRRMG